MRDLTVARERPSRHRRNRKVAIEQEPRLNLVVLTELECELTDVTTDTALGRPRVLECLDVEENPDRRAASRPDWSP
jgi:hypothetical protein